MIIYMLLP